MIAFYDKDTGIVKRYVGCPDAEIIYNLGQNEDYLTVDGPRPGTWKVENGALVEVPVVPPTLPYTFQRAAAYPPIGDQLDALWKGLAAVDASLLPQETLAMMQQVAAVKDAIPKV